ncbi:hypothetical protein YSY22_20370 [Brevibacillus formosus]
MVSLVCGLARLGYNTNLTGECVRNMTGIWKSDGMPKTLAFFCTLFYIRDR